MSQTLTRINKLSEVDREWPPFGKKQIKKTRKEFGCWCCARKIAIGESCEMRSIISDYTGKPTITRVCNDCLTEE